MNQLIPPPPPCMMMDGVAMVTDAVLPRAWRGGLFPILYARSHMTYRAITGTKNNQSVEPATQKQHSFASSFSFFFTLNTDVQMLQWLISLAWINGFAPPLMDVSVQDSHLGFIVHLAPPSEKKPQHVYRACLHAFCCPDNAADAGSSWDHVAK